jgi:hypothetical protein
MDHSQIPLSMFEVDCDGSACGSPLSAHVHAPQGGSLAVARVVVRGGKRIRYEEPAGITRLEQW